MISFVEMARWIGWSAFVLAFDDGGLSLWFADWSICVSVAFEWLRPPLCSPDCRLGCFCLPLLLAKCSWVPLPCNLKLLLADKAGGTRDVEWLSSGLCINPCRAINLCALSSKRCTSTAGGAAERTGAAAADGAGAGRAVAGWVPLNRSILPMEDKTELESAEPPPATAGTRILRKSSATTECIIRSNW